VIILDTNVISELMLPQPEVRVIQWLDRQPQTSIWTTSITIFEIRFGLQTMPVGKRRATLAGSFERWLGEVIQKRFAGLNETAAELAASLAAARPDRGRPGDLRDIMIAGIVLASHATLATRNVKHFDDIASSVVNPWED
jgi:predicted nucleic acid-binding protein